MPAMLRWLYNLVVFLALPFAVLRLYWRSRREVGYRHHIGERFGQVVLPPPAAPRIWIHAVSAGETIAAVPLAKRLLAAGYEVLITNMTPAGRERCQALLGDSVMNVYVPYDFGPLIDQFLARAGPSLMVLVDTELWPGLIGRTAADNISVVLVNGRLSESSFNGYRRWPALVTPMLDAIDAFQLQSPTHATRFGELGVPAERIEVSGSIKFDSALPVDIESRVETLQARLGDRPVLVGASTHPGEEAALLDAFDHPVFADWLLVLVPRHLRRLDEVLAEVRSRDHSLQCFTDGGDVSESTKVFVIDAMGELLPAYGCATLAFVGGSLKPVGGHNMIEAALLGAPVVMGPHVENIEDIAAEFVEAEAMVQVESSPVLADTLRNLARDADARQRLAGNATAFVESNRGALDRAVHRIEQLTRETAA